MGIINLASNNSTWKGLDYCQENKVNNCNRTQVEAISLIVDDLQALVK